MHTSISSPGKSSSSSSGSGTLPKEQSTDEREREGQTRGMKLVEEGLAFRGNTRTAPGLSLQIHIFRPLIKLTCPQRDIQFPRPLENRARITGVGDVHRPRTLPVGRPSVSFVRLNVTEHRNEGLG